MLRIPKKVLFVRHGSTEATRRAEFCGITDVPLDRQGEHEAASLKPLVDRFAPNLCLCSPLVRCRRMAELLMSGTNIPVTNDSDLREMDFGLWERRTSKELMATDPNALRRFWTMDAAFAPGGGERMGEFLERCDRVAQRILSTESERVLVVSHGGVIRAAICGLLKLEARHMHSFELPPGSYAELLLHDHGSVLRALGKGETE
jgi:alpha-ribazole phosphatase